VRQQFPAEGDSALRTGTAGVTASAATASPAAGFRRIATDRVGSFWLLAFIFVFLFGISVAQCFRAFKLTLILVAHALFHIHTNEISSRNVQVKCHLNGSSPEFEGRLVLPPGREPSAMP